MLWINLKKKRYKYYNFLSEKDVEKFLSDLGLSEEQKIKIKKCEQKILEKSRGICFLKITPKTFYSSLVVFLYPEYKSKIFELIKISDASIRKGVKIIENFV